MNKLYFQITSLLIIVGLGAAWTFNLIDLQQFGMISVALLGAVYGIFERYQKAELKGKFEDQLCIKENNYNILNKQFQKSKLYNEELLKQISVNMAEIIEDKEIKPKKRYYKTKVK